MLKIGKFDILEVTRQIKAKSIRIGSDTDLRITPKEKLIVESKNAIFELAGKFLTFVPLSDGNEYGFGVYVDKESVQLGYGTRIQFNNHALVNGIEITESGAVVPTPDILSIEDSSIINMVNTIFA